MQALGEVTGILFFQGLKENIIVKTPVKEASTGITGNSLLRDDNICHFLEWEKKVFRNSLIPLDSEFSVVVQVTVA